MRSLRFVVSLMVFGGSFPVLAQEAATPADESIADPAWLREELERERVANRMPALAAAVVVDGKVLAASAVGYRKAGSPVRVKRTDAFHLGSLVKPMSATMFGTLVDEGVLGWEMTMADMFPELVGIMQPAYEPVTIAQLLSHSGGFPYQPRRPEREIEARAGTLAGRRYEYVKAAVLDAPGAPPGTKVIYSGGGIVVSCVAERRTHQSYETLMKRRVFGPLGMANAGFGCMATEGTIDGPWGHTIENGHVKPIPPNHEMAIQVRAAVGKNVHCSIIDLARFAAFHGRGGREGRPLLRPETFRRLHTPVPPSNFAPGWSVEHDGWIKGPILAHNGSIGQNYAVCRVIPSEGIAACVMTNIGGHQSDGACERVLSRLLVGLKRHRLTAQDHLETRPVPPPPDVALEDLEPLKATTGFGHVRNGITAADTPLRLDGVSYVRGIGVHANSVLEYDRKPEYERFVGIVGIDDKQTWHGTIVVKVLAGDRLLQESPVLRGGDAPWPLDVRLPDVRKGAEPGRIRLVVDGTPDGTGWDLTDWIRAGFVARRSNP